MNIFCKCGYLPRQRRIDRDEPMVGSVPVRMFAPETDCHAVGFKHTFWDAFKVYCTNDAEQKVAEVPLCARHARIASCTLPHDHGSIRQRWIARTDLYEKMPLVITDGGHKAAGFGRSRGACVYRAIAIAEQKPYREVAEALFQLGASKRMNGVSGFVYEPYLQMLGWRKHKTKGIFLRKGMLPNGRIIVHTARHMLAVIDGTIHDTYDSSERGTRRVQAYFTKEDPK